MSNVVSPELVERELRARAPLLPDFSLVGFVLSLNSPLLTRDGMALREFPKIRDTLFWGPYNKDPTT